MRRGDHVVVRVCLCQSNLCFDAHRHWVVASLARRPKNFFGLPLPPPQALSFVIAIV